MKTITPRILFFAVCILLAGNHWASAQQNYLLQQLSYPLAKATNPAGTSHPGNLQSAERTTGTAYRISQAAIAAYDGAAYTPTDSLTLSYSGDRGSDLAKNLLQYDLGIEWAYNTGTSSYDNFFKVTQTFDGHNNILTNTYVYWIPWTSAYRNTSRTIYTYDANNNMLTYLSQNWDTVANAWANTSQQINSYDSHNNLLSDLEQQWTSGAWVNSYQYTYTYDASNNLSTQVQQSWSSGAWVNYYQYTYTYDSHNNMLTELEQQWSSGAWVDYYQYSYTYDVNNNKLTDIEQYWSSGTWYNNHRHLYTYDASNDQLTDTYQDWSSGAWVNDAMSTYTYDASKNQTSSISQNWDLGGSVWVNHQRTRTVFTSFNQPKTITMDEWNTGGSIWQPIMGDQQTRLYYQSYTTGIENVAHTDGTVNIYPSPASNIISIDLNWNAPQSSVVMIYDAAGRVYKQWQVSSATTYHAQVPVSNMPAGNYFVKIIGGQSQLEKTITFTH